MFNIGIIGLGHISEKHIVAIQNNSELCLTGGYDIDTDKARTWCKTHNTNMYDSLDRIIQENDILVVLTPHHTHSSIVKEIVLKNKWCICEKPLCIKASEFDGFAKDNKVFVIFQNRYNKAIIEAKNKIENGVLGKINFMQLNTLWYRNIDYYIKSDWRGKVDTEGGILYNQGIHSIDVALYLLNANFSDCKILSAEKYNYHPGLINTESVVKFVMHVKGVLVDMFVTTEFATSNYENSLLVSGTKSSIKISGNHLNKVVYPENVIFDDTNDIYGASHIENYRQILQYIKDGKGNPVFFSEGLDRIKLIENIYNVCINKSS